MTTEAETSRYNVLLIGASGMLGRAWTQLLEPRLAEGSVMLDAPRHATLDLSMQQSINSGITPEHDLVINCAAWTDVDGAEGDEESATGLNGRSVGWLAQRCKKVGATLIHYSTDYVFDGQATTPYTTAHALRPLNAYGRSKASGEQAIRESGCSQLILRTSWLYGPWGRNFVLTIARAARQNESLKVVNDQRGRPCSVEPLAEASFALYRSGARGTLHVTDGGECTWFEFAKQIAKHANPACQVVPCTSDEFPRPAPRPAYSVLDLSETEARIGTLRPWSESLADVLRRL